MGVPLTVQQDDGASGIQTCTRLIRNIACDTSLVSQLVDKRTLKILGNFAVSDPALNTRLNCAVALCEMTRHPELLLPFVDNGGLAVCFTPGDCHAIHPPRGTPPFY